MIEFIDTIFGPVLGWLGSISAHIREISIPLARPLNLGRYFGHFSFLGPQWLLLIKTVCGMAFTYLLLYFIMSSGGLYAKFKDWIKWW